MKRLSLRMQIENMTSHGFRSSFRDWAGECTNFPREVCEAALAHAVGNAVELAYRRGDALEKRRALMEAWAALLRAARQRGAAEPTCLTTNLPLKRSVNSRPSVETVA